MTGTILISILLACIVILIIAKLIKDRKKGRCSCPGGCSGCAGCALSGMCRSEKFRRNE